MFLHFLTLHGILFNFFNFYFYNLLKIGVGLLNVAA